METGPCSGASFLNMLPDTAARTLLAWLGRFAGTGPGFMSSRYAATTKPAISPWAKRGEHYFPQDPGEIMLYGRILYFIE